MTSNGLPETLNHIQYNLTTYAKGKYAYVFQGQRNGVIQQFRGETTAFNDQSKLERTPIPYEI